MSNYYVHRNHDYDDELAHAFGFRKIGSQKPGHKYYAREGSPGHYLYFYSPAEYAAYKGGRTISKGAARVAGKATGVGKAAYSVVRKGAGRVAGGARSLATSAGQRVRALPGNVRNTAGKAGTIITGAGRRVRSTASGLANEFANRTGLTARTQRDNATNPLERYHAQKRYDRTPLGAAEGAIRGAGRRAEELAGKARSAARGAGRRVGELAGRARSAASSAANAVGGAANRAAESVADATGYSARKKSNSAPSRSMRNRAQAQYNSSPMGRVENAVKSAPGRAKSAASSAGRAISGAAGRAGKVVRRTAGNAAESVAKATGYTARQRANSARSYADRRRQIAQNTQRVSDIQSETRANRKADQARAAYNRTPMGRVESAARTAGRAIGSVPGRVSSAAASATTTVRNRFRKKRKGTYT